MLNLTPFVKALCSAWVVVPAPRHPYVTFDDLLDHPKVKEAMSETGSRSTVEVYRDIRAWLRVQGIRDKIVMGSKRGIGGYSVIDADEYMARAGAGV